MRATWWSCTSDVIRFIHTADWQLGMSRHFLSPEAQSRFAQDRIEAIRRIGELAREHEARFAVVCGDVFEDNQVERQTIARALDAMGAVPMPLLLLPGNHDPLDAASVYRCPTFLQKKPDNVIVLESRDPVELPGLPGLEIVGVPWETKRPLSDLTGEHCSSLEPTGPGVIRVVVGHGMVDALAPDPENPALVRVAAVEAALQENRLHYLALGDRHSATSVGTSEAIWYSGAPVATDFDEEGTGQALLVELSGGTPARVTELPVGTWRFLDGHFDLNGPEDIAALSRWLAACQNKERAIVRLGLVGSLSVADKARVDDLQLDYEDHFASLRIWARHTDLAVLPDALDAEGLGLSGYAHATWEELAASTQQGGEQGRTAAEALALLFRLSGGATP